MAFERDLEMDNLRDADILAAYAEGRLAFRPGLGTIHCPHCKRGVGLLLPGNALGRTAAARTLLTVGTGKSFEAAIKSGDVVVVVPKIRQVSDSDRARATAAGKVAYDSCIEEYRAWSDKRPSASRK